MSEKKILGTASPNTKGVLGVASSLYKAKLLLDNPFPEAGNLRPLFLNEVWKEAHKLVPPRDGSTLKLTSDVEIVVSLFELSHYIFILIYFVLSGRYTRLGQRSVALTVRL